MNDQSGVKPKKQMWLDYLLESIGKEKDLAVSKYEPHFRAINDDFSEGILNWKLTEPRLRKLTEEIVSQAKEPYRTRLLLEATIRYIHNPNLKAIQ